MSKKILIFFLFFLNNLSSQSLDPLQTSDFEAQQKWVDSIMNSMTIEQKIGQLFMVAAYSNRDENHKAAIIDLIKKYHIGNLIFMQGEPVKQAELTNTYQAVSETPLLIGIDGEWGLDMRLKNTFRYPWNMTLGAIRDNNLIEQFGVQLGKHSKRLGIHINFAPVVDININPENPIIGNRSFGENTYNVTEKSIAFTKGIQSQNVLASAKHFPGHGDTASDSHHTLPVINFDENRLDSVELYPYKRLIGKGLTSVMVAHLSVPALEANENLPSSLSQNIVTNLLQYKMGFSGLIFTDGLNMKAAANFASPAQINLAAILAGNDVLVIPFDIPETVLLFKESLKNGTLTETRLNHSVQKILKAKYWVGLHDYKAIETQTLLVDLNSKTDELLHKKLVENSITVIKNEKQNIPVVRLEDKKIAYVKLGDAPADFFVEMLQNYTKVDVVSDENLSDLLQKLKKYDLVILGYHKSNKNPWKDFKFENKELVWLQEIARKNNVILNVFASPYSLLDIKTFTNFESIIIAYQNSELAQRVTAQIIFGGISAKGKLPVSIKENFKEGRGLIISKISRLNYGIPEEVQMDSKQLSKIDSVANEVMTQKMAPGLQVLVARHGTVIFNKSYGYYTDAKEQKVTNASVYDLASLTKILATLPMIMKSVEDRKFSLESTLGEVYPKLQNSNKDTLKVKEVISHVARLKAWIPFYIATQDSITKENLQNLYQPKKSSKFSIQVADNLYLKKSYKDSIFKFIKNSEQLEKIDYRYSDLGFILFKNIIEYQYDNKLDKLVQDNFYKILGANRTTYNPLQKMDKKEVVPTEKDTYFRHQLLQGYVHDMGAAMLGGVAGHAGLFANANDVAKIMQMFLQKGFYGNKRFLRSETVETFTKRYYDDILVRRGLGFDKPQLPNDSATPTCGCVSDESFGHSGFTGTFTWADPKSGIVYVFLSNRVYPTMENRSLLTNNIRTNIQQIIQDAVLDD